MNGISSDAKKLRDRIEESLIQQGFSVQGGRIGLPEHRDKSVLRRLHGEAVMERRRKAKPGLARKEAVLLERIANGSAVTPEKVSPALVEVLRDSQDELLFRYAAVHWSIPVSSGYGRRLRYLVIDESTGCLIGILGLGDPVFSLKARDDWVGWDAGMRRERLHHVLDAFVLGAVPPFSSLLFGKLMAMFCLSSEVLGRFEEKYAARESLISGRALSGKIAMITTLSALGRSSVYNRLRGPDGEYYLRQVGRTRGWGDFHFSNGLYSEIIEYADEHCTRTAKHKKWGDGFRNRREVVKKVLPTLGLSAEWLNHGIQREVFVGPTASNTCEFLRGEDESLVSLARPASELFAWFRDRWMLPRSTRHPGYRDFRREAYALWLSGERDAGTS
ncbi:Druantia anti-phage system protein DruA [Gemmatimonadota bacterium]